MGGWGGTDLLCGGGGLALDAVELDGGALEAQLGLAQVRHQLPGLRRRT